MIDLDSFILGALLGVLAMTLGGLLLVALAEW